MSKSKYYIVTYSNEGEMGGLGNIKVCDELNFKEVNAYGLFNGRAVVSDYTYVYKTGKDDTNIISSNDYVNFIRTRAEVNIKKYVTKLKLTQFIYH